MRIRSQAAVGADTDRDSALASGSCSDERAIQDHKLVFYEQRFSNDGPSTAKSGQAGDRYEKVDQMYGEITYHGLIVTKASHITRLGNLSDLCEE